MAPAAHEQIWIRFEPVSDFYISIRIVKSDAGSNATESFIFERKQLLDRGSTEAQMSLNRLKSCRWILAQMLRNHLFLNLVAHIPDAHPLFRVQVPRADRFRWVQSARVNGHMHCRHGERPKAKKTDDHQCTERTVRLNCDEI